MRASPYDLSALGYRPVAIETAEGKAEYVAAQREFGRAAQLLRERLPAVLRRGELTRLADPAGGSVLVRRPAAVLQVQRAAHHHDRPDQADDPGHPVRLGGALYLE